MGDLLFYVIALSVGSVVLGIPAWKAYKMRRAADEPMPNDECVACNARDVTMVAPGVIRCNQCGFTGGSGMAAYQQQLQRDQVGQMTPRQRYEGAIANLREAQMALLGVEGLLKDAVSSSTMDMIGFSGMERGHAKQSAMGAAVGQMRQAQELIRAASLMLATSDIFGEEIGIDFSSPEFALDVSLIADNILVDLAVHARIGKLQDQSRRMMAAVDDALVRLASLSQPA